MKIPPTIAIATKAPITPAEMAPILIPVKISYFWIIYIFVYFYNHKSKLITLNAIFYPDFHGNNLEKCWLIQIQ